MKTLNKMKSIWVFVQAMFLMTGDLIAQSITNVHIEQKAQALHIHYDLDGVVGTEYTVYPVILCKNGSQIQPRSMGQSNIKVTPGKNKLIIWQVYDDVASLTGEISVSLRATGQPKYTANVPAVGGGPSNAFLSMLLPGLGDVFVNNPGREVTIKPIYVTACYAASVLLALHANQLSRENYDAYLSSGVQDEMDTAYQLAEDYRAEARFYSALAGLIWASDVIRVAVKGSMNNREMERSAQARLQLGLGKVNQHTTVGLTYRF